MSVAGTPGQRSPREWEGGNGLPRAWPCWRAAGSVGGLRGRLNVRRQSRLFLEDRPSPLSAARTRLAARLWFSRKHRQKETQVDAGSCTSQGFLPWGGGEESLGLRVFEPRTLTALVRTCLSSSVRGGGC